MMLEKFLINKNVSIKFALSKMINISSKTLIVTDKKKKLIGILSDGDIRKKIATKSYLYLKKPISEIYNKKPIFILESEYSYEKISQLFIKYKIDLIPVVSIEMRIKKIYRWFDILNSKQKLNKINMPVIIMAGGKGERLRPLTEIFPKALIPVDGEPIIKKTINMFKNYSIKKYFLLLGHKSDLIKKYLNKTYKTNELHVSYFKENKSLGTAGGLYKLKKLNYENYILINCDIIIDYDISLLSSFHLKNKNDITICVANKKDKIQYGLCNFDNQNNLVNILEKPFSEININTGLYIINRSIFNLIKNNSFLNMDSLIIKAQKANLSIKVFKIDFSNWHEIGMIKDYLTYIYDQK